MTFTYTKHTANTWPVIEHEIVFECETGASLRLTTCYSRPQELTQRRRSTSAAKTIMYYWTDSY